MPCLSEPDTLTITQLGLDDADALGAFFDALSSDAETARFFLPHPLTPEFAFELCSRLVHCQDRYYALWDADTIIGYAMLRGWDAGYEVPSFGVCLAPNRRQEGLGQQLLQHAIAECRRLGAPRLRLTVYRDNERAVYIYWKFGFVFTAKNADELVGVLEL